MRRKIDDGMLIFLMLVAIVGSLVLFLDPEFQASIGGHTLGACTYSSMPGECLGLPYDTGYCVTKGGVETYYDELPGCARILITGDVL